MPSGYTEKILDGEVTTAQEFAKVCAHAFIFSMRDEGINAPIRMPKRDDSYYAEELTKRLAELKEWDESTEEEKYAKWSEYVEAAQERRDKARADATNNYLRLRTVGLEIEKMKVPEALDKFKEFMIDQISATIQYDGTFNDKWYVVRSYETWVDSQRSDILQSIEFVTKRLHEAEERYQKGRAWVSTLAKTFDLEVVE